VRDLLLFSVFQTEAPLIVRPMLPYMTRSEIHAVMTGGYATIAGGVLAAYILFGVSSLSSSFTASLSALTMKLVFYVINGTETAHF